MKKAIFNQLIFASLLVVLLPLHSLAQIMNEEFDYSVGSALTASGVWNVTGSSATPVINVTASSISYPGYLSSGIGQEVTLANSGQDLNRTITPQTSGVVYISFLANISAATTNGDYFFHVGATSIGNTFRARFFAKKDASNNLAFGIAQSATPVNYSSYSYSLNTTYLVVIRFTIVSGSTNDVSAFYINPPLNAPEPSSGWIANTDASGSDLAQLGSVALRQGSSSNAATLKLDGIRVSTAWSDIVGSISNPTLVVNPTSLSGFLYEIGQGPSSSQSYTLSGVNLTGYPGDITVSGSTDFEVSSDNSTFGATASVPFTAATLDNTLVYIRLKAGLAAGTYASETIGNTGGGVTTPQNVTVSGQVLNTEPSNYVTNFAANPVGPEYSSITTSWTDAAGSVLPDGYLVKASLTSYDAIVPPVDGVQETDGTLVKNVAFGLQTGAFTGLNPNTIYYFKIYPYTLVGSAINYKTDDVIPQTSATTSKLYFHSIADGNWDSPSTWEISGDSTTWTNAVSEYPNYKTVIVTIGDSVVVNTSLRDLYNLNILPGGRLLAGSSTAKFLYVYGSIYNDGEIGNGSTTDGLGFDVEGPTCRISGTGIFNASRMAKFTTFSPTTNLIVAQNVSLLYTSTSSAALSNGQASTTFDITVKPGKTLRVPNAKIDLNHCNLLLESDATGTGMLLDNGTISNMNGTNATIQRYITGSTTLEGTKYHNVSVPLTADSDPLSGLFYGSYLYYFDEPTSAWTGMGASTITPLDVTRGYLIYYPNTSTIYNFTGKLNTGSFNALATYSDVDKGYNLVPNPYPSAIDWDAATGWTKTNITNSIWIWNSGNYATYIGGSGGVGTNGGTNIIPVGQSFFIQSTDASTTLAMTNSVRVSNTQAFYKNGIAQPADQLRLKAEANNYSDEIVVRMLPEATNGFDGDLDARKMYGLAEAPQLNSVAEDESKLSINSLPYFEGDAIVPLDFTINQPIQVTFTASGMESFYETVPIYLEDLLLNQIIDLRQNPVYTFSFDPANGSNRFQLRFAGVTGNEEPKPLSGYAFISNRQISLNIPSMAGLNADIRVYNALGQEISSNRLVMNGIVKIDAPVASGVFIIKAMAGNNTYTTKVVNK